MAQIPLQARLASFLKNTKWKFFMEVLNTEMSLIFDEISKEELLYQVRELDNVVQLRELNEELGNTVDLILFENESENFIKEYLRKEVLNTVFKITSKGTYEHFKFILNKISKKGEYYLLFVDDLGNLFRGINSDEVFKHLLNHNKEDVFLDFKPFFPFSDQLATTKKLDSGLFLDSSEFLDDALIPTSVTLTNYTALELNPKESRLVDGEKYYAVKEDFLYLMRAYEYGRGSSEVPHSGVQLNFITNKSEKNIKVVDINIKSKVRPKFNTFVGNKFQIFKYIRLSSNLEIFVEREIYENEIHEIDDFYMVSCSIPGRYISPDNSVNYVGDGINTDFEDSITKFPPIPKSIRVSYRSGGQIYTARDNGFGILTGKKAHGSVDYLSGKINIYTFLSGEDSSFESPPDSGETINISYSTSVDIQPVRLDILNEDEDIIFTGSFPKIQFFNEKNHVSFLVAIDRR